MCGTPWYTCMNAFLTIIGLCIPTSITRTRILTALFESEMCVCDIGKLLNMTKSAISHQLRILRQSKLVKARKCGKEVIYSLADNHVKMIFKMAIDHVLGKDCD